MPIESVRKRDGSSRPYDRSRIVRAVEEAAKAVAASERGVGRDIAEGRDRARFDPKDLGERVASRVEAALGGRASASVEEIQDAVESSLIALGASEVAKAYILYRSGRSDVRRAAGALGVRDDLKLGLDVVRILEARYLRRDADGRIAETPGELFARVARAVARGELAYGGEERSRAAEEQFLAALRAREFLPNSPVLMNAGTELGQLAACFVLPVEDSIEGIFSTLGAMARIHQSGGGTGFSFSRLRPRGDLVSSTGGAASGPVSFIGIFDATTEVIRQGGRRRGANMGVLRVDHPDIAEFIRAKSDGRSLRNFNLSVAATDEFMARAERGEEYDLVNPRTGRAVARVNASAVLDLVASSAWASGEPGMLFLDAIARANPTPELGEIESTNPCGEQPLLPWESCILGSVNLPACLVRSGKGEARLDWDKLARLVELGVRFLDDCIEVERFPLEEIRRATLGNRKIGLGVMGFADLLYELRVPYDSEEALSFAEKLMAFVREHAHRQSRELARERGAFPNWQKSALAARGAPIRNASVTTIAPTGTISLLAGVSSGIEPRFALVALRTLLAGSRMLETSGAFERALRERSLDTESILAEVARRGSVRGMAQVPEDIQRVFATALDIEPSWHVRMQAAFQRHTDSAVSKTVNLPPSATPADVRKVFVLAHELGAKGVTVYRYGSRGEQVLSLRAGPVELGEGFCSEGRECGT